MSKNRSKETLTLVLGGTGKTGRRVSDRLQARGVPTRVASRSRTPSFDWNDPGTWEAALDRVTAAYISYAPDLAIPDDNATGVTSIIPLSQPGIMLVKIGRAHV